MAAKNRSADRGALGEVKKRTSISDAASELLRMAQDGGVEQNYFFKTTFDRYKFQLRTMARLKKEIQGRDVLVEKEYVKGRPNLAPNPAIAEYNKTATAANQTVTTLLKIIVTFADGPVMNAGSAGGDDDDL